MSNVLEETRMTFECPKCGGYTYGTSNATGPFEQWVGHCHNDSYYCDFTWPRSEDWKYFRLVHTHVTSFETSAEYKQAELDLNPDLYDEG